MSVCHRSVWGSAAFDLFGMLKLLRQYIRMIQYEQPKTWRTLNLCDSAGAIRASHMDVYDSRVITIHRDLTDSSYLAVPGVIPAGDWKVGVAGPYGSEFRGHVGRRRLSARNRSDGGHPCFKRRQSADLVTVKDAVDGSVQSFALSLDWKNATYVWSRFKIRANDGELLAFTNPVFCGVKEREALTWKFLLDRSHWTDSHWYNKPQ